MTSGAVVALSAALDAMERASNLYKRRQPRFKGISHRQWKLKVPQTSASPYPLIDLEVFKFCIHAAVERLQMFPVRLAAGGTPCFTFSRRSLEKGQSWSEIGFQTIENLKVPFLKTCSLETLEYLAILYISSPVFCFIHR